MNDENTMNKNNMIKQYAKELSTTLKQVTRSRYRAK